MSSDRGSDETAGRVTPTTDSQPEGQQERKPEGERAPYTEPSLEELGTWDQVTMIGPST